VNPDNRAATLAEMFAEASRGPGVEALATLSVLCDAYAREARAEIDRRLGLKKLALPLEADRWLAPKEAARVLGTSVQSLSRRWRTLPFCRPGITRGYRVSSVALEKYMREPLPRKPTGRYAGPTGGER
jgi:hypothetical protein